MRPVLALTFMSLVAGGVAAASGVDAHGLVAPPTDGAVDDPILGFAGRPIGRGGGAVGLRFGLAVDPAVAWRADVGGSPVRAPLLGRVYGGELGGLVGLSDRVALGATIPFFAAVRGEPVGDLSSAGGPALGDAHLYAPVALVGRPGDGGGLSVVPWVALPTGASGRSLGAAGAGAGAAVAASARAGPLSFYGNLGFELRREREWLNVRKGSSARGAAGLGLAVSERVDLRAEIQGAVGVSPSSLPSRPDETRGAGAPVEALAGVRARLAPRALLTVAGGGALTPGVGAARARLHAQVAVPFGGRGEPAERVDADFGASLRVVDDGGRPIPGATARAGGVDLGLTDLDGALALPRARDRRDLLVEARGFVPAALRAADRGVNVVALQPEPVVVAVRVADAEGRALAAEVALEGPGGPVVVPLDALGRGEVAVAPGDWSLRVTAGGFGAQERSLALRPGQAQALAEVLLAPSAGSRSIALRAVDPDGRPVEGAALILDGRPFGSTASGGGLRVDGLGASPVQLRLEAEGYLVAERDGVHPGDGEPVEVVLAPEPGSVELVVTSPHGPVPDATARFAGPSRLTFDVGPEGRRAFVLRPGTWTLLVGSPRYGLQQRTVEIPEGSYGRRVIEVVLRPPEAGDAALAVRIVDGRGAPVDGAEILLDGASLGRTTSGGALRADALAPGPRRVEVRGEQLRPLATEIVLDGAVTEATLVARYVPGATRVRAHSPRSAVIDATARFQGAAPVPPLPLGPRGEGRVALDAGAWLVLVASPEHGLQQRGFQVIDDDPRLHEVEVVFGPIGEGAAELDLQVVDPRGRPVTGARVALGGAPLGATGTDGGLTALGLVAGARPLAVEGPALAPHAETLRLAAGRRLRHVARLGWGVGAVLVRVVDASGAPVPDATLRFAGSRFVAPSPVDAEGELVVALDPGSWTAVIASPSSGLAQRSLTVPARPGLTSIVIALDPAAPALGRLLVRVQDPDGRPVAGARIALDEDARDEVVGGTAVFEVEPGRRTLAVQAPGHRPARVADLLVRPGDVERVVTLDFEPVAIRVAVTGPDGAPVAAVVRLDGPADVAPLALDRSGRGSVDVRPGGWSVLAEAPGLGVGAARVALAPGDPPRDVAIALRPAEVDLSARGLSLRQAIPFDFGSASLRPAAAPLLDEVAAALLAHPELRRVDVEGHTDDVGQIAYNVDLSRRRAEAVRDALVLRGVAPERLRARGFGPSRPLVEGDTDAARAANRRVTFVVVESVDGR